MTAEEEKKFKGEPGISSCRADKKLQKKSSLRHLRGRTNQQLDH